MKRKVPYFKLSKTTVLKEKVEENLGILLAVLVVDFKKTFKIICLKKKKG